MAHSRNMTSSPTQPPISISNSAAGPTTPTLLSILLRSHNHPYPLFAAPTTDHYTPFHLHLDPPSAQIGFIPKHVLEQIKKITEVDERLFVLSEGRIGLSRSLDTFQKRTQALDTLVRSWREADLFKDALDGWREERYAVYSSSRFPFHSWERSTERENGREGAAGGEGGEEGEEGIPVFELERAACALFGLVTYGVHLTAYTESRPNSVDSYNGAEGAATFRSHISSSKLKIWVPRRSTTKATWPNYLDNTVAGGITSGDDPFHSILRECEEEASLAEDVVRERIRQGGVITYVYRTLPLDQGMGYLQPEVEYVYDLPLPSPSLSSSNVDDDRKYIPRPNDGEAQSFQLLSIEEVMTLLKQGQFKPNCALVILDFLIRKGVIQDGDEGVEGFVELVQLLHRDLGLPMP